MTKIRLESRKIEKPANRLVLSRGRKHIRTRPKQFLFASLAVIAMLVIALGSMSCSRGSYSRNLETITFGTNPNEGAGLIYIAQSNNFFADKGLKIDIKYYDTGIEVTEALLKGEIDMGSSSEYPFLAMALAKKSVSGIGVIDKFTFLHLFARKDAGIESVADLKGKKIGTTRGTVGDYYLGRFLELNGLTTSDVKLIDVAPSNIVNAISSRTVDGILAWGDLALQIRDQLGSEITEWQPQNGQPSYAIVSARNDWINSHPETIQRFLKSLDQAQKFVNRDPAEAKSIIQKALDYNEASITSAWPEHQYTLSLDQPLILAMEDEARWMISNNLTGEKNVPNFLGYLYTDGLKSINPGAMRIAGK